MILSRSLSDELLPFSICFSADGTTLYVSRLLRDIWHLDEEQSITHLADSLTLARPFSGPFDAAWLPELTSVIVHLHMNGKPDRVVRGQLYPHSGCWLFTGFPLISSVADLEQMGLHLSRLPLHAALGELLIANEANSASLHDAQVQAERLAEVNDELRAVNVALGRFVPDDVLETLGVDGDAQRDAGQRAEAVARFVERLQRALEFREEFLAKMSHELRTPLNAVLGISEALQEGVYGAITEKQIEMLSTVEKSGEHLLSLINDVLDLSKIEAGQESVRAEACDLQQLCGTTVQLVRQQVEAKGLELVLEYRSSVRSVRVDARRIRQVLLNLLSNAMKFTDEGTIEVTVTDLPEEESVCICVRDTGLGIAAADQSRLFQPFYQVEQGLTRKYRGTGLGLAISQRTVQLHGGRIEIESRLGEGSCFRVCLPIGGRPSEVPSASARLDAEVRASSAEDRATPPAKRLARPWEILVVDDVEENRQLLVDMLAHRGFAPRQAEDGCSALRSVALTPPDLVLLDVQMPDLSGFDVLRCLRAMPSTETLPVVLVTSLARPTEREMGLAVGAQGFITKPFRAGELWELLTELLPS